MNLIARFRAWRERRYWEKRHFEFVRNMILDDSRWLAEFPVADELTLRYRKVMSEFWYQLGHEDVAALRERLRAKVKEPT